MGSWGGLLVLQVLRAYGTIVWGLFGGRYVTAHVAWVTMRGRELGTGAGRGHWSNDCWGGGKVCRRGLQPWGS